MGLHIIRSWYSAVI